MSLLNQVLQDLEKRNTNNIPEEYEADILSHVKSISVRQYKSYYQIASLMLFTSIIVFTIYHFKPNQSAALIIAPQQKLTQALKPNNSAKYVQTLITEIPLKEDIKKTRQAAIKNQAVITDKQTTKPITQKITKTSPKQQAEHYFAQAQKNQSLADRQALLKQVLTLNPQQLNAHLLLANTLLQQGLTEQAIDSLKHSLKVFPKNIQLTNILSQLFLQSKQSKAALTTLLKIKTPYIQDETFLSLLAAAYQQNNDSLNSLNSYQKLLSLNPEKAEYWLGLAITLEKQNKPQHALTAYRQALNKNPLKAVIVSYIKQRISLLN